MAKNACAFAVAEESIGWAEEAISEFKEAFARFVNGANNCGFVEEFDSETREYVYKFVLRAPIPKTCRRKATEALTTTRHSIDQTVYAAISCFKTIRGGSINYPFAQNPTDLDGLLKRRKIPDQLWDAIKLQEPYPRSDTYSGGNDLIRALAAMSNNKHTIGLTVEAFSNRVTFGPSMIFGANKTSFMNPIWDPMKNELVLVRASEKTNITDNAKVSLHVLFKDPKLSHPVDAFHALNSFLGFAQNNLEALKAICD